MQNHYSPPVKLAFSAIRWLFLFLLGFSLACIFSASLNAPQVVTLLLQLFSVCLKPLVVLTFCSVAIAVFLESLK